MEKKTHMFVTGERGCSLFPVRVNLNRWCDALNSNSDQAGVIDIPYTEWVS